MRDEGRGKREEGRGEEGKRGRGRGKRGHLIKNQYFWVFVEGTCNGDSLFLPSAQSYKSLKFGREGKRRARGARGGTEEGKRRARGGQRGYPRRRRRGRVGRREDKPEPPSPSSKVKSEVDFIKSLALASDTACITSVTMRAYSPVSSFPSRSWAKIPST
jgi:hypothetical protein